MKVKTMRSTPAETMSTREKFSRLLRWGGGAVAMTLALAACGGGGAGEAATSTVAAPVQVSALARAQQSVSERLPLPHTVALAAVSSGIASDDFESGMSGWSNWGNAQVVPGQGTSGSHALQVGTGAGGAGLMVPGIVPGTAYHLSAQVRAMDPAEPLNIGVKMLDASGNEVASGDRFQQGPHASTDWAATTVDIVAPANAAYALVWVWKVAGSSYGYVDDVVFGPADGAPPPPAPSSGNMISSADSGFESGMADWSNWGNAQVVAGAGSSGSNAMQVGTGAGGAALRVPGVVAGTAYRLTAQLRVSNASDPVGMGVNFYNASGSQLLGYNAPAANSTAYGTLTFDVVAPANSAYALVWVWKNAGTGYAYVDDVAFGAPTNPPAPPPAPPDSNLVSNGGFESGMTDWVNWGNASVVSGQAHSGASALSVTAPGGAGQDVGAIVPGATYRLIAQAKVSAASDKVFVGVNFLNEAGTAFEQMALPVSSTSYSTVTFDIRAMAGAVRAVVWVWKDGGSGVASVDDVVFGVAPGSAPPPPTQPPPPPPSGNLIANGGFESGLANWVNWGNAVASPTGPAAGSSAAQVGSAAGGFGQSVGGVAPGTTYRAGAQVKVSSAGELGYFGLKFTDDAGNVLGQKYVTFDSTAYATAQIDLAAPADATRALVYVWKDAGSGFAYVDEVTLTPAPTAP